MPNSPIRLSSILRLNVPPKIIWDFLADTDRLNKSIGLPAISFTPVEDPKMRGHYKAATKYFGVALHYEEFPFDFVRERHYEVTRRFQLGFLRDVTGGIRMRPTEQGTELEVYAMIEPHNVISSIASHTVFKRRAITEVAKMARLFKKEFAQ